MTEVNDIFNELNNIDVSSKTKEKNGLTYLSWASAWTEVKKRFPDATYIIHPQIMDDGGNTRFWHDDGKSGWVEVSLTIRGLTHTEVLAVMDFKNQSIPAEKITSADANKALKRCLTKVCAMHGLGMYIYEGEDMPEEMSKNIDMQNEVRELAKKRSALSDKAKEACIKLCKEAEKEANPDIPDDEIAGNIGNINDIDILTALKRKLTAVRK